MMEIGQGVMRKRERLVEILRAREMIGRNHNDVDSDTIILSFLYSK